MATLADKLDLISQGATYYESALREALAHPVIRPCDIPVINRYLTGDATHNDRMHLQTLAIAIRRYGK